jgi:Zn-dependent M28 family amino/carboxypeptidase
MAPRLRRRAAGSLLVAAVVLVLASASLVGDAGSQGTQPTRAGIVARLPREISSTRLRADLVALERIADRTGGSRAAGTTGYRESVRYVGAQLRRAGYAPRVLDFRFVEFRELAERARQLTPSARDLEVEALDYSPSTPSGGVRGRIVTADDGCELRDFDDVAGTIALVRRGKCLFSAKARNAARAGAVALIVFNAQAEPFDGTLGGPRAATIPVAGLDGRAGRELAASENAVVELELVTRRLRSISQNVVADARRGARSVLMVGAHLDSVRAGPGINDNATGVAAVLEIARAVKRIAPRLDVRFAFWGAEELGLIGSRAYAATLREDQVVGYLNFDVLGSPSGRNAVYRGPYAGRFLAYFERRGLTVRTTDISGRSDHVPFARRGIPVGGLYAGDYPCYHRACDRLANVDLAVLETLTRAAAFGVASFAPLRGGRG